jgi:drug/metabolite transporter (DMT)-like permease
MSKEFLLAIFYGLIFGVLFGTIDALFFLVAEEELTAILAADIRNSVVINLIEGSLSACVSLLIASYIETKFPIHGFKSPWLDCLGILIGTALVSLGYFAYIRNTASIKAFGGFAHQRSFKPS